MSQEENDNCVADTLTHSFECRICKRSEPFPDFPVEISEFARIGKKFLKKHENCKEKEKENI